MVTINLSIDDELNRRFREAIVERLGMKKGNIKIALEEAIDYWVNMK